MQFSSQQLLTAVAAVALPMVAAQAETVTFQAGSNGYNSVFEAILGYNSTQLEDGTYEAMYFTEDALVAQFSTDEDHTGSWYLDGARNGSDSANIHGVIRFDDIIGAATSQIPAGARITSATLEMTTGPSGNNKSGGRYTVGSMLQPVSNTSKWSDFGGGLGLNAIDGAVSYSESTIQPKNNGETYAFDVTRTVNSWANGQANEGFHINPSTTDGWLYLTSANENQALRPKLTVTYDMVETKTYSFQKGVNGYNGSNTARLSPEFGVEFGDTIDSAWLDGGADFAGALMHFDGMFGNAENQVASDEFIAEAYVVLTTTGLDVSYDAMSGGDWALQEMNVEWDVTGTDFSLPLLYDDFGGNGPDVADGELKEAKSIVGNIGREQEAWFDVTEMVRAWQAGGDNFGVYVSPDGTEDGWRVFFDEAANAGVRPELVIVTQVPEPAALPLLALGAAALLRRRRQA